jgi:tRNA-2-methylthio-N6-dimethylallyladenosine synthase
LANNVDFADLLERAVKISGLERIRFMTSHPKDLSDKLVDTMAKHRKICNHMHLPLQAGSNKVLKEMNRKYTQEDYLEIVNKMKDKIPDIAITTDIIIGFPGETEEDFKETLAVAKAVEFDSAFTFLYSIREGTPAATKAGQVPEEEKKIRFQALKELIDETAYQNNQQYLNQEVSVLVEGNSKKNDHVLTGRTETSKTVNFKGDEKLIGEMVTVKITAAKTYSFDGVIV